MSEKLSFEKLEKMAKKLEKKYLGKEFGLLELDNLMQEEVDTDCSLFENKSQALEEGCWVYLREVPGLEGLSGICVDFELVDKKLEDLYLFKEDYDAMESEVSWDEVEEVKKLKVKIKYIEAIP